MNAQILNGKQIAQRIRSETADQVAAFRRGGGSQPCLAAVLVGDHAPSEVYVRSKQKACEKAGIDSRLCRLPADSTETELLRQVDLLNQDRDVHGILVQLPLPSQIAEMRILDAVHPLKDVDCFHPENVGRLLQGRPRFLPCTPHGVQQILHRSAIAVAGRQVVIVGRSDIVGKPLAAMLVQRSSQLGPEAANATVTLCHSRTANLAQITQQADVLVAAIGRPKQIRAEMIKPGATVIDVGINRTEEGLVGDVDFEAACQVAGAITPVPGGVGPLTVAMLLANTLSAAELQQDQQLTRN